MSLLIKGMNVEIFYVCFIFHCNQQYMTRVSDCTHVKLWSHFSHFFKSILLFITSHLFKINNTSNRLRLITNQIISKQNSFKLLTFIRRIFQTTAAHPLFSC
jgi:hypothetical protein